LNAISQKEIYGLMAATESDTRVKKSWQQRTERGEKLVIQQKLNH
jgi:hypothetical protein